MVFTEYHVSKRIEESLRELSNYDPVRDGELTKYLTKKLEDKRLTFEITPVKDVVGDYPYVNKIRVQGVDKPITVKRRRVTKIRTGFVRDVIRDEYLIEYDNFLAEGYIPGEVIKKWEHREDGGV